MKTLHFVRHGETEQNKDGIWQGHTNTQLSKVGKAQAKHLSDRLNLKNQTVNDPNADNNGAQIFPSEAGFEKARILVENGWSVGISGGIPPAPEPEPESEEPEP